MYDSAVGEILVAVADDGRRLRISLSREDGHVTEFELDWNNARILVERINSILQGR